MSALVPVPPEKPLKPEREAAASARPVTLHGLAPQPGPALPKPPAAPPVTARIPSAEPRPLPGPRGASPPSEPAKRTLPPATGPAVASPRPSPVRQTQAFRAPLIPRKPAGEIPGAIPSAPVVSPDVAVEPAQARRPMIPLRRATREPVARPPAAPVESPRKRPSNSWQSAVRMTAEAEVPTKITGGLEALAAADAGEPRTVVSPTSQLDRLDEGETTRGERDASERRAAISAGIREATAGAPEATGIGEASLGQKALEAARASGLGARPPASAPTAQPALADEPTVASDDLIDPKTEISKPMSALEELLDEPETWSGSLWRSIKHLPATVAELAQDAPELTRKVRRAVPFAGALVGILVGYAFWGHARHDAAPVVEARPARHIGPVLPPAIEPAGTQIAPTKVESPASAEPPVAAAAKTEPAGPGPAKSEPAAAAKAVSPEPAEAAPAPAKTEPAAPAIAAAAAAESPAPTKTEAPASAPKATTRSAAPEAAHPTALAAAEGRPRVPATADPARPVNHESVAPIATRPAAAASAPGSTHVSAAAGDPGATHCRARIESTPPDAVVTLDGRMLGHTPLERADVPCGPTTIAIVHPRYREASATLEASKSSPASVSVHLVRPTTELHVVSPVRGARVTVNGHTVGTTPCNVTVTRFETLKIEATAPGKTPWKKSVYLKTPTAELEAAFDGP